MIVAFSAGSKNRLGSLAGSWAWTKPLSWEFLGAFWQKTEFRNFGGLLVKSYAMIGLQVNNSSRCERTGGVFFSTWRYSMAAATIVVPLNCLLASEDRKINTARLVEVFNHNDVPIIVSAKSCWEHSGCAARSGVTAWPARVPQTAPGHALRIFCKTAGCSCPNLRGCKKTALSFLSNMISRPNAPKKLENVTKPKIAKEAFIVE